MNGAMGFVFTVVVGATASNWVTLIRSILHPSEALERRQYRETLICTAGWGVMFVWRVLSPTATLTERLVSAGAFLYWLSVLWRQKPPKNPVPRVVGWVKDLGHRLAVVNEPVAE